MTSFAVTWDYRCPFARNAHEHVLAGLAVGADWDVTWAPFSLNQGQVDEGEPDVWDDPSKAPALFAMQAGIAVRDGWTDVFPAVHAALFRARHDDGRDLRERAVVEAVLREAGADADAVLAEIDGGAPLDTFRKEHEAAVAEHDVWGVPTFIAGGEAAFVRLMDRPIADDPSRSVATIERVVALLADWPDLNELKHTSLPR